MLPSTRRSTQLGLTDRRPNVRVGSLSGGQRKRVQHRRRAADPAAHLLPRRADVGPRPGDRPADDAAAAAARGRREHRRADHARDPEHDAVRQGRVPGPRRAPGVRRHARTRRCATSTSTEFDEIYDRLADERTPEEWGERFRATPDSRRASRPDRPSRSAKAGAHALSGSAGGRAELLTRCTSSAS